MSVLSPQAIDGYGGTPGSSVSLAKLSIFSSEHSIIPSLPMLIFFTERLNPIHSARPTTKKKNPHLMFFGSVPWHGTHGL